MYWHVVIGPTSNPDSRAKVKAVLDAIRASPADRESCRRRIGGFTRAGARAARLVQKFGWGVLLCNSLSKDKLRELTADAINASMQYLDRYSSFCERLQERISATAGVDEAETVIVNMAGGVCQHAQAMMDRIKNPIVV